MSFKTAISRLNNHKITSFTHSKFFLHQIIKLQSTKIQCTCTSTSRVHVRVTLQTSWYNLIIDKENRIVRKLFEALPNLYLPLNYIKGDRYFVLYSWHITAVAGWCNLDYHRSLCIKYTDLCINARITANALSLHKFNTGTIHNYACVFLVHIEIIHKIFCAFLYIYTDFPCAFDENARTHLLTD